MNQNNTYTIDNVTYFEIQRLHSGFQKIYQQDLNVRMIKLIRSFLTGLNNKIKEYEEIKNELAQRYGAKDDQGKLKVTPSQKNPNMGDVVFEDTESEQKYLAGVKELSFERNTLTFDQTIQPDEFFDILSNEGVKVSGSDYELIETFLTLINTSKSENTDNE